MIPGVGMRHSQAGKRSQKLKCGLLLSDDGSLGEAQTPNQKRYEHSALTS